MFHLLLYIATLDLLIFFGFVVKSFVFFLTPLESSAILSLFLLLHTSSLALETYTKSLCRLNLVGGFNFLRSFIMNLHFLVGLVELRCPKVSFHSQTVKNIQRLYFVVT